MAFWKGKLFVGRCALKDRLHKGLFLLDGAMGTQLIALGVEPGKAGELLNLESPGLVLRIHKAYLHAGADAVLTNTFGGNGFALARHGLVNRVIDVNTSAAKLARKAAGRTKYVLGDIGPTGDFLEPLGHLKPDQLQSVFADQAKALLEGGVDGFIIETMTAVEEITIDVKMAVSALVTAGADAVGFNCGSCSLDDYIELAKRFVAAVKDLNKNVAVFAEPNAGIPEVIDGIVTYKVTPDAFAEAAQKIYEAGVNIIGGCCGTSPAHIEAVSKKLRS